MYECLKQYEEVRRRNPIKLMARVAVTIKNKGQEFLADKGCKDL